MLLSAHKRVLWGMSILWLAMGGWLFYKGVFWIAHGLNPSWKGWLLCVVSGLVLGGLKGKFVLSKTVDRTVRRLASRPLPLRLKDYAPPSYFILIAAMMVLGMTLNRLPIPMTARGIVDLAIGFALIYGALLYMRSAVQNINPGLSSEGKS